ncbi:hypothetical protein [Nostoc sp.]|uniref:hypothetical protein n=1 Tax=Nostoc sp. TaxID=1180 RepID=UPI002FF6D3E0
MKLDSNRPDFAVQTRRRNLEGLGQLRVSSWVKGKGKNKASPRQMRLPWND